MTETSKQAASLERTLGPVMLWGLGVGYVISGMYFGWNLGLPQGGTLGLAIATAIIIVMYVTFTFSYTEMACAIPKAGGVFDYAESAFGENLGFIGGMAQNIEFLFAPPAIAFAIGAYLNTFVQLESTLYFAIGAYIIFTLINIKGVKLAASFELVITLIAVFELLFFACLTLPHFKLANLKANALPHGYEGVLKALPFAIWFFLAIEGVANVAEETVNPKRNIKLGFGFAILTLVILCILTFVSSIGVAGWEAVVYEGGNVNSAALDTPLPLALKHIVGDNALVLHLIVLIGIFGLVASFHGIILAAGRAVLEFGRKGYAPKILGQVHPRFHTPANALIINMLIGIIALLTHKTSEIITIAAFGALSLYVVSMLSLFKLRQKYPLLERPFQAPCYPLFPLLALMIATFALVVMTYYNPILAVIFYGILFGSFVLFKLFYSEGVK